MAICMLVNIKALLKILDSENAEVVGWGQAVIRLSMMIYSILAVISHVHQLKMS